MAPEQIIGGPVDARTDIFALGCTLHALVADQTPLATPGNLERLLRREPLELSSELPDDVARIVRRATAAVPSARYATAAEMADEVGVLASHLRADPKGALIKWLDSLEQPTKHSRLRSDMKASFAFDALLMPEAVLERDEGSDSWHLEMTKTALAPVKEGRARSSRMRVAAALAALVGVLSLGVYVVRTVRHVPTAAAMPPLAPTSTLAPPSVSTSTQEPEPAPTLGERAPPSAVSTARNRTHVAETAQPGSAANLLGTVAVRGGEYRGASIAIDGKVTAFGAPHYFDLPVGKHVIELRIDGGVMATGAVNVLPEHTPTAPVYWP